jgi:hypothetical protein
MTYVVSPEVIQTVTTPDLSRLKPVDLTAEEPQSSYDNRSKSALYWSHV